jgi:hypothetical protein
MENALSLVGAGAPAPCRSGAPRAGFLLFLKKTVLAFLPTFCVKTKKPVGSQGQRPCRGASHHTFEFQYVSNF